jgi:hypothetical protein
MKRPFGYLLEPADPTTMPVGLLLSPYKIPWKPTALDIQENQRAYSKSKILAEKFEARILFI